MIGSMEDSFTNIFKLAELNGLNWKKFSFANPLPCLPGDDNVLSAYAKCMREGVLCTWRRLVETRKEDELPAGSTEHKKELWCFWWGEKPALLDSFKELESSERDVWKWGEPVGVTGCSETTGLDYQARSLLFKSLHNAVGRKLCSEGWIRLGRWFILLPEPSVKGKQEQINAAISLNFFLNGTTICCAIEPGVPPPLTRLKPSIANPELLPMQVITAPWGLRGYFSGQFYRSMDFCVKKLNDEWKDFAFALPNDDDENNDEPFAVELAIGDENCAFKVIYPARLVFLNIQNDHDFANNEEALRIREGLHRTKIENTVMAVAQYASHDFSSSTYTSIVNNVESMATLAPSFSDEKCKAKPIQKETKKSKFRLMSFHKRQSSTIDRFNENQSQLMCDNNLLEANINSNGGSTAPQTPTGSPVTTQPCVKSEPKDEEPSSPSHEEPPSPKFVEEKVEIWSGLKFPVDGTGITLKSDKCRPTLQLDGLEPEIIYRKRSDDALIFSEFMPRKRLKRVNITEEVEAPGIKRLPPECEPTFDELKSINTTCFMPSSDYPTAPLIKTEFFHGYNMQSIDAEPGRITLKTEPIDPSYMPTIDYEILTPSPEQKNDEHGTIENYNPISRYRPVRPVKSPGYKKQENFGDPNLPTSTLTPPTPKPSDFEKNDDVEEFMASRTRRKSTYELAEEKAQTGVYAPYKLEPKLGIIAYDNVLDKIEPYKPSWSPGSNSFKIREARKLKQQQRISQRSFLCASQNDQSKRAMRQPVTPGSASHGGPKTPGMAPGTPGQVAPPGTPGAPLTPGYPGNPRTPGGPPSVGPLTPFAAHTPGSRQPHTPGTSTRSPGHAGVAPSPINGRDFNAPKTPRTPRTPGSVRTPGRGSTFNGSIRGVSSLQEVSALLLSLVLGDSVLDAHCDRNFIQAPLCACRNDVVGIDGHVLGLRSNTNSPEEDECSCGFSAIASRSSAVGPWGGILLEDEVNLVGPDIENEAFHFRHRGFLDDCLRTTPAIPSKNGIAIGKPNLKSAAELLSDLVKKSELEGTVDADEIWPDNVLDFNFALFHDAVNACTDALKTARCVIEPHGSFSSFPREVSENVITEYSLPQQSTTSRTATHETIRLLSHLQPMLQDAIQKDSIDRSQYVKGPLTWSEFVRVGDQSLFNLAPLPVPQIQVGGENEMVQVAPSSLQYWDKIGLEPTAHRRDLYYVAIVPESTFAQSRVKRWFPELSTTYSRLNYGNHVPLPQFRDSRPVRNAQYIKIQPGSESFAERYFRTLERELAPLLARTPIQKKNGIKFVDKERPGPGYDRSKKDRVTPHLTSNEPQLVVYIFEPATLHEAEYPRSIFEIQNEEKLKSLIPEPWKHRTVLKFIPSSILAAPMTHSFDKLASEIFRSCLNPMDADPKTAKSFTGFGPTSERKKQETKNFTSQYKEPFICLPDNSSKMIDDSNQTLYCSYCPSQDHRWLMVSCTDERGKQIKTQILSIDVPNKYFSVRRTKKYTLIARLIPRIWEFCYEAASHIYPSGGCRLVVTRIGRIGAGETKEWAKLISIKFKKKIKPDTVKLQIISALITSLEPDVTIRIIPEQTKSSTRSKSSDQANVLPTDVNISHLAVFATSSTIRMQSETSHDETDIWNNMDTTDKIFLEKNGDDGDDNEDNVIIEEIICGIDEEKESSDGSDESLNIDLSHQPLAVAIWISTSIIPSGLPRWFGPLNRNQPTSIRVALHINQPSKCEPPQDHPLDSPKPVDSLRYVVENLEQLSWLTSKRRSGRELIRSALPVHVTAIAGLHRQLTILTNRVQSFNHTTSPES